MARIMVVEDEPITAMDLEEMLVATGHEIAGWSDMGEEAIEKAKALHPDLVLMDIRLQGEMSGIEAAAKMRGDARERGELMPVLFVTVSADEEAVDRVASTSPYGCLVKPFTERSVAAAVRLALARAGEERESRERESFLSVALSSLGEALVAVGADGRCRFANARALDLLGVREEGLLGERALSVLRFFDDDTGAPLDPISVSLREGRIVAHSAQLTGADGVPRPVQLSSAPMIDADGAALGVVLAFSEIGSREEAREASFSASLQDEISNPIMYSLGALSVALREIDTLRATRASDAAGVASTGARGEDAALERIEALVRSAQEGASRVASVMRELRSSTPIELGQVSIRPVEILELAVGACAAELEDVEVVRDMRPTPIARASKWRLSRILADELRAGLASLEGAGTPAQTLVLYAGVDARGHTETRITLRAQPSSGRASETSRREVDPMSGAKLAVLEGPGTRSLSLILPSARVTGRAEAGARRGCVLVVDDEQMIGRVLELILAPHHDVTTVDSAARAIEILERRDDFDVVLMDLSMPDTSGRELYRWLAANRPELAERVLVMSAGAMDDEEAEFLEVMTERTLEKPFRVDRLLELVAERVAMGPLDAAG